jgi:hypothetical protein
MIYTSMLLQLIETMMRRCQCFFLFDFQPWPTVYSVLRTALTGVCIELRKSTGFDQRTELSGPSTSANKSGICDQNWLTNSTYQPWKNKSWKNRAMLTFSFFCIVVFKKSESWTFPRSVNNHYSLIWCFAWRMTTINLWVVPDKPNINFFPTYNFPICNSNWCEKCEQCEITFFRYAV